MSLTASIVVPCGKKWLYYRESERSLCGFEDRTMFPIYDLGSLKFFLQFAKKFDGVLDVSMEVLDNEDDGVGRIVSIEEAGKVTDICELMQGCKSSSGWLEDEEEDLNCDDEER